MTYTTFTDRVCRQCQQVGKVRTNERLCTTCVYYARKSYMTTYLKDHRLDLKRKFRAAKSNAKRRQIPWQLSLDQFITFNQQPCFYCYGFFSQPASSTGSGLDRIDNSKGYNQDNCLSCCRVCNMIRGHNLTVIQTQVAVNAIINYEKNK